MNYNSDFLTEFSTWLFVASRILDLGSTYYVTPTFSLEINQWMKKVGWKSVILINVALCVICPMVISKHYIIGFAVLFLLISWRNLSLAVFIKGLGDEEYLTICKKYYQTTKSSVFWMVLGLKFVAFFAIWIILQSAGGDLDSVERAVGKGFLFFSLFLAIYEFEWRLKVRRNGTLSPERVIDCEESKP